MDQPASNRRYVTLGVMIGIFLAGIDAMIVMHDRLGSILGVSGLDHLQRTLLAASNLPAGLAAVLMDGLTTVAVSAGICVLAVIIPSTTQDSPSSD